MSTQMAGGGGRAARSEERLPAIEAATAAMHYAAAAEDLAATVRNPWLEDQTVAEAQRTLDAARRDFESCLLAAGRRALREEGLGMENHAETRRREAERTGDGEREAGGNAAALSLAGVKEFPGLQWQPIPGVESNATLTRVIYTSMDHRWQVVLSLEIGPKLKPRWCIYKNTGTRQLPCWGWQASASPPNCYGDNGEMAFAEAERLAAEEHLTRRRGDAEEGTAP